MNKGGAPKGNKNGAKGKDWETALRYALDNYESGTIKKGLALREIAKVVVSKALAGDKDSVQEIGNRLDGKAPQAITGENGGPLSIIIQANDTKLL